MPRTNLAARSIHAEVSALDWRYLSNAKLLFRSRLLLRSKPNAMPANKQAVAQYGFAAARRHALETYGPEAVKTGDKCFRKGQGEAPARMFRQRLASSVAPG